MVDYRFEKTILREVQLCINKKLHICRFIKVLIHLIKHNLVSSFPSEKKNY